jgi:hypothetical protein
MFTSGCIVNKPIQDAGFLSLMAGALLGLGTAVVGVAGMERGHRAPAGWSGVDQPKPGYREL